MTQPARIIKAGRRPSEDFDREKLHKSIVASCLSERSHEGSAAVTADKVCESVLAWLSHRPEVTSNDIRRIAGKNLSRYHPGAAYTYEQHKHTI